MGEYSEKHDHYFSPQQRIRLQQDDDAKVNEGTMRCQITLSRNEELISRRKDHLLEM